MTAAKQALEDLRTRVLATPCTAIRAATVIADLYKKNAALAATNIDIQAKLDAATTKLQASDGADLEDLVDEFADLSAQLDASNVQALEHGEALAEAAPGLAEAIATPPDAATAEAANAEPAIAEPATAEPATAGAATAEAAAAEPATAETA